MEDFLLSESELEIKLKARKVAKSIPPDLIRAIESETKKFPREFVDINAKANMLGLRFSKEYGGRGASWVADMAAYELMKIWIYNTWCDFYRFNFRPFVMCSTHQSKNAVIRSRCSRIGSLSGYLRKMIKLTLFLVPEICRI